MSIKLDDFVSFQFVAYIYWLTISKVHVVTKWHINTSFYFLGVRVQRISNHHNWSINGLPFSLSNFMFKMTFQTFACCDWHMLCKNPNLFSKMWFHFIQWHFHPSGLVFSKNGYGKVRILLSSLPCGKTWFINSKLLYVDVVMLIYVICLSYRD